MALGPALGPAALGHCHYPTSSLQSSVPDLLAGVQAKGTGVTGTWPDGFQDVRCETGPHRKGLPHMHMKEPWGSQGLVAHTWNSSY
jgi:hypothetical protein